MGVQGISLFRKKHPIANQLHLTLLFEQLSSGHRSPRAGDIGDIILRCDTFGESDFNEDDEDLFKDIEMDLVADEEMNMAGWSMQRLDEIAVSRPRRQGAHMDVTVTFDYDSEMISMQLLNQTPVMRIGGLGDCIECRASFLKSGKTSITAALSLGEIPLFTRKFNFTVKRSEDEIFDDKEVLARRREAAVRRAAFRLVGE